MSALVSSSRRPLPLTMRADLEVRKQAYQGREYFVIKDPLGLKYYRFEAEEYSLLTMLDGQISLDQLRQKFDQRFAPQTITIGELHQLLGLLYRNGLLISDAPGQGVQLLARDNERWWQRVKGGLGNILTVRFRGVDPDRWLTWLNGHLGWLFSPAAGMLVGLLVLAALLLISAELEVFRARLPGFRAFFAVQNWFALAVTLTITKILHEFGHGLACKRFGGESHEMGLMLLVGTPCLYCNVTDSWMIPSKWRRAAIGAAGMYVELILASLATFLWWNSQPGMLNGICLNVMFVCSISTLVFNANPLMRYDGYYILADLLEIPNLRQKGQTSLQRKLGAWLLGLEQPDDPFLPQRYQWLFAGFTVASAIYSWMISISIFWFIYKVLQPYGLKIIGQGLALAMLFSLIGLPLIGLVKFFFQPGRVEQMNRWRMGISFATILAAVTAGMLVPLPYYVTCSLQVQPQGATSLYVDVPGEVKQIAIQSGYVKAGETILELDDLDARAALVQLQNKQSELKTRLDSLQARAHADETALQELAQTEEAIAAVQIQLAQRQAEIARLVIRSPVSGILIPAPSKAPQAPEVKTLAHWQGRPLDIRNVGAYLETSTLVCRVAQPDQWEATLVIDEEELEFVQREQPVDIFLAAYPGLRLCGLIEHISQEELQMAPAGLSHKSGGDLATKTDASGQERPVGVSYQASVQLIPVAAHDPSGSAPLDFVAGATGHAKIHAGYQSAARRLWRFACRTFQFEM